MKANPNFKLRNIGNLYFIIPITGQSFSQNQIIHTNETGAFLWECLQRETTKKGLTKALQTLYDVDDTTALADITNFLNNLQKIDAVLL